MTAELTSGYFGNEFIPPRGHPWFPWSCPKPTVRILFYTDDPQVSFDPASGFGVSDLRDLLLLHNTFHANFQIDLMNRHAGGRGNHRLTTSVLNGYDQVWFFGVEQCDRASKPHSELTNAEVDALRDWMGPNRQGGVLVTGDHANPRPFDAVDGSLNTWVNLGRSLGHRVPRAGRLRRWEGLPSAQPSPDPLATHNTQVPDGFGTSLDNLTLQDDEHPQKLLLTRYPAGFGWPFWLRHYRPHPLFCGRSGPIEVFPDHMHEGALDFPTSYPAGEWPSGPSGQPLPEVLARGTDKRFPRTYDLVSAYDGAQASVGRIVADTTWHHYFNVNLRGFPTNKPVRDAIADFYVNLAVWLASPTQRQAMRCWFWWYLAVHPAVHMVKGNTIAVLGQTAMDVLGRSASRCMITELAWPFPIKAEYREKFPWPPDELVLGGVIRQYHEVLDRADGGEKDLPGREHLAHNGINTAVEEHLGELRRLAEAAGELPHLVDRLRRQG